MLPRGPKVNNKGSVLIIVLWSLFFLAMLAVAVYAYVIPYPELSSKLKAKAQMHYFANAGVQRAIFEIENDDQDLYDGVTDSWSRKDEAFKNVPIGGGVYSILKDTVPLSETPEYGLTDEEGKININKASREVLKNLFEKVALVESEEANDIAAAILDWRDQDDVEQEDGKENDYYRALEHPYDCKNSDFEVKEELREVGGVTSEMFAKIKDHITVYGEGAVNVNTAGIPVLVSLGLDEALAKKIVSFRAGAGPGEEGETPKGVFTDASSIVTLLNEEEHLSGDEITQLQRVMSLLGVRSDNFRGQVLGSSPDGGRAEKILFLYDRKERIVKSWREV